MLGGEGALKVQSPPILFRVHNLSRYLHAIQMGKGYVNMHNVAIWIPAVVDPASVSTQLVTHY